MRHPSADIPLARNYIGFVPEPQPAMLAQHLFGRLEIGTAADCLRQSLILDLRDIDRSIPGGKQRRGSDGLADLAGQGMHVVAEQGSCIGIGAEIEAAPGIAELLLVARSRACRSVVNGSSPGQTR